MLHYPASQPKPGLSDARITLAGTLVKTKADLFSFFNIETIET
jgi:hypothetical protein